MKIDNNKGCGKYFSAPFGRSIPWLSLCALLFASPLRAEPEVRGLWVVRDTITSPEKVEEVVNFADRYDINVMFVQVRGRGDAYYRSYFVPGPEDHPHIPVSFDPLATIIELAHEKGIAVHAWFNMYLTWSADTEPSNLQHLYNSNPEWFMNSVNGLDMAECPIDSVRGNNGEGRYISPGLQEVRSYLSRMITEVLVGYDIDGVHMDYVRYPGRGYDFHQRIRQRFIRRYGIDPVAVVQDGEKVDPTFEYLSKWVDYRTEYIDMQVRSIARRIKIVNKNIYLSAAVKPAVDEAYYEFGQNWAGWLDEGIVDFVVTMSYFPETDWVEDVLNDSLKRVNREKVIGGIGVYKLTSEGIAEQIRLMSNMDLLGYCLFSYTTFLENPHFADSLSGSAAPLR